MMGHAHPHPHRVHAPAPLPDHREHRESAHDQHAGHTIAMFRNRFVVCSVLTIPILIWSESIQQWLGFQAPRFTGSDAVVPVLSAVVFLYGGTPFLQGAVREWRARMPGMMTLIALAISVAFGYSLATTLGLQGMPFYWELATLIDVMLLGHWLEMAAIGRASQALEHLVALLPPQAHVLRGEQVVDVPLEAVQVGDRVLVRTGEQVPVDGIVLEGASSVNEAFLTGESRPVPKQPGEEVVAGSINLEGRLVVEARRVGAATTLHQLMRLVEEAQHTRSRFQVLGDRLAFWLTVVALLMAAGAGIAWHLAGADWQFTLARAVTVLVIACPHALGLAIPLILVQATGRAARNGILIRNREAIERARTIQVVAFDKTGTLTEGRFAVTGIWVAGMEETTALRIAATLEQNTSHPLAQALLEAARERDILPSRLDEFRTVPGKGVEGHIDGALYRLGRPEWLAELGIEQTPALQRALAHADQRGETTIVLFNTNGAQAAFTLADRVRTGAREVVAALHAMGIQVVMITGDAEAVARTVAEQLQVDTYYARVLPDQKAHIVLQIRERGQRVAFVGDGINDAPALLAADIGFAIGAGTNVAIESADVVLVENDPRDGVFFLRLARLGYAKMVQNLFWATGYNLIALPLAAGVAARWGLLLSPAVGALLMSLSTVIVAINALLLRRARLDNGEDIPHEHRHTTHALGGKQP